MKCHDIDLKDWFDNITYKIQTITLLLAEAEKNTIESKAFHNSAAYLSGYPVEFLLKIAICLSDESQYPALHASEELFKHYKITLKKSPAQQLINLNMIKNMPIAKLDINKFRYNPHSDFRAFGYTTTNELRKDLVKVTRQADQLKKKFLSKYKAKP